MQILTIWKGFEAFEYKLELLEKDSKHLNLNWNHLKGIWSTRIQIWAIQKRFEALESKFERFERDLKLLKANSNHSNQIQVHILAIEKGF